MTTEKKFAIAAVLIGILVPLIYTVYVTPSFFGELELTFLNLLYYWGCLFVATIFYTRVRAAAVTGSALAITALFMLFAYWSVTSGDPKGGSAMWAIYLVWSLAAGFVSIFPALFKPQFIQKSWLHATICSVLLTYSSFIVGLVGFKLFDQ
ncbi:hypothetical protein [Aggregatibacter kilianii]|uniref:hypothetical protein n=1 Tax=Aggregatibacter kilianii TaxID=2025884 RepID=UPI000D65EBD5|nr:hypothetical protein [Aggregatibacter kilianii]